MKLYKFITLAVVMAAALTISVGAKADTFQLSQQNGGILPPAANYGSVTVLGNVGATDNTQVTIEFLAAAGYWFHNAGVGWNIGLLGAGESITLTSVTTCTGIGGATCTYNNGGDNFDGYGSYDQSVSGGNGSSAGLTDVKITITGTLLDLADFEDGDPLFAAQVSPAGGCAAGVGSCTGFAASGPGTITTNVPEPGTISLVGVGLVALFGLRRKQSLA